MGKDYNKKYPYLLDGLSTLYAADEKNNKKAANEARKIAYMEGLADYEDLLYKRKEENAKFTTLEYKPTGEKQESVKYSSGLVENTTKFCFFDTSG